MEKIDLSKYDNSWYKPGRSVLIRIIWYFVNACFFKTSWCLSSSFKVVLLRVFGAEVGKGVNIKPCVNIKYPWNLSIGDFVWIGENCWIDNLAEVVIESNVCLSQGAMLLCGNHNYKSSSFGLMVGEIIIKEGSWVGAKSIVCPGVTLNSHSILSVGSVTSNDLDAYTIYRGNPAVSVKKRVVEK